MNENDSFLKKYLKVNLYIFTGVFVVILSMLVCVLLFSKLLGSASTSDLINDDPFFPGLQYVYGDRLSNNQILVINVSGVILGDKDESSDPFGLIDSQATYGYQVARLINKASEDNSIKAVILEINSPGGTIYGSRAIASAVENYRKSTGKPIVGYIKGLGASGGYYAVTSVDKIYADFGSTIGSIGVIFGPFKFYDRVTAEDNGILSGGVVTQNGIETRYFTAGESKDIGNPYRQLTDREVDVLQKSVNNEYDDFVSYVSRTRKLDNKFVRNSVGALIYDNKSAKELGLIDDTINKTDLYQKIAKELKLENYKIVSKKQEPTLTSILLGSLENSRIKKDVSCGKLDSMILAYHGDATSICGNN